MSSSFALLTIENRDAALFEQRQRLYCFEAYFSSCFLSTVPFCATFATFYFTVSYWMIAMNPSFSLFLGTLGVFAVAALIGFAQGFLIGTFSPTSDLVVLITNIIAQADFLVITNSFMPAQWLQYISITKYTLSSTAYIQFDHDDYVLAVDAQYTFPLGSTITGDDFLRLIIQPTGSFAFNFGMLFVLLAFYLTLAYICGKYIHSRG